MRTRARPIVMLAVLAVLAGCTGPGLDKAGESQPRPPVVLTMANWSDPVVSEELDGFAGEVQRLSAGTMRIDIKIRWRFGQSSTRTGSLRTSERGGPIWASPAVVPGTPSGSTASGRSTHPF